MENFTAIHPPLRAYVVIDTKGTSVTHQRCEMKSAAVRWCEMARYNKGGDKNPNTKIQVFS
jgi:hypothetical protein